MNRFLAVLFVLVICLGGVGLYRGWFSTETNTSDHKTNVNLSVDREKIQEDMNSLKKKTEAVTEKKEPVTQPIPPKN